MVNPIRNMRIIAVPLTRPNARIVPANGTKLHRLTYYQFQISAKQKPQSTASDKPGAGPSEETEKKGWLPEQGIVNWATGKAADVWSGFGKAEGGWKLKTYQFGEKLVDRMEFEELALKSIDPSLGPSITQLKRTPVLNEKEEPPKISLIFPPSILSPSSALSELRAYTEHRIPRHRRGFYGWMFVAPITAPFMIIPIIPNLPFFFCVWRAWSHYRAYKSSKYLQSLLERDLIAPEPSEPLDAVYQIRKLVEPTSTTSTSSPSPPSPSSSSLEDPAPSTSFSSESSESTTDPKPEPPHIVLLTRGSVPAILSAFELKPDSTAAADLYRAVEQARVRVSSGRAEL